MKAGPGGDSLTISPEGDALCCAVHATATMIIAVVEGGAAACLDALRANEKAGDGRSPQEQPTTRYVARWPG